MPLLMFVGAYAQLRAGLLYIVLFLASNAYSFPATDALNDLQFSAALSLFLH